MHKEFSLVPTSPSTHTHTHTHTPPPNTHTHTPPPNTHTHNTAIFPPTLKYDPDLQIKVHNVGDVALVCIDVGEDVRCLVHNACEHIMAAQLHQFEPHSHNRTILSWLS